MPFTTLVHALVDDGYVTAAVIVISLWVLSGLVRYLARVSPDLVRAASVHTAVRRALRATGKAERDQAYRVLKALVGDTTQVDRPPPQGKARPLPPPAAGSDREQQP